MSETHFPKSPADAFALRPVKAAVVSEISEATASSPAPPEERVNLYIGNPVQDPRLVELYARVALGAATGRVAAAGDLAAALTAELGWDEQDRGTLEFLLALIRKSAPYLPRGGFLKNKPVELIRLFGEWLTRQPEPLAYDFREKTGKREVILASGGVIESLRVFFHALASQLRRLPATIFSHGIRIFPHLTQFGALRFRPLPEDEAAAAGVLESSLGQPSPSNPSASTASVCSKPRPSTPCPTAPPSMPSPTRKPAAPSPSTSSPAPKSSTPASRTTPSKAASLTSPSSTA